VIASDENGADLESVAIDGEGNEIGEPRVQSSTWTELRDHASFPASLSHREAVARETPLGRLDGWLYTMEDPDAGTVSEFFFANSLPGAPVDYRVTRDGELVSRMQQITRQAPVD